LLVAGLSTAYEPWQGGVLVPAPDVVRPIDPGGGLEGRWPAGIPAGTPVTFQAWFSGPGGVGATNGLVTVVR
jgi:hypothetical protein